MTALIFLVIGYFLGSIPFGLVLTRLFGLGDIRSVGSGNIGATNVLRTGRKDLALATLVLDSGKGALAVIIAIMFTDNPLAPLAAGFGAILGHLYPFLLGFKGGKGVATALGTCVAINFILGGAACLIWVIFAGIFRISSLSALAAFASLPLVAAILGFNFYGILWCVLIACLIWYK